MLLVAFVFTIIALSNSRKEKRYNRLLPFVFWGILIGTIGGFIISWNLDPKDTIFYPVGYWMIATPLIGFLGGIAGLIFYALNTKKKM